MPMTMTLKDPKTGREVTFDWPRDTPPSNEEMEKYVFAPARQKAMDAGLIPNLPGLTAGPLATTPVQGLPYNADEKAQQYEAIKKAAGAGIEFGLPLALSPLTGGGSLLARLGVGAAIDTLAGGAAGAITGKGVKDEALANAGLGMAGTLGGELLPIGANMVGQALGGKIPSKKAAMAFAREGGRQWDDWKPRIGLGNEKRTRAAMDVAGEAVSKAELANPARIPIETELTPIKPMTEKSFAAAKPLDVDKKVQDELFERMSQHSRKKGVWKKSADWGGQPPVPGKRPSPNYPSPSKPDIVDAEIVPSPTPPESTALSTARRRPLPSKRRVYEADLSPELDKTPLTTRTIQPVEDGVVEDVTPDFFPGRDPIPGGWYISPAKDYSMREAGDLKRAAGQRSSDIIEARKAKMPITPDDSLGQQIDAGVEKAFREAQYEADFPKTFPTQSDNIIWPDFGGKTIGPIEKANQRMSDLHVMHATNKALKDPTLLGRVGQFTTRAALGGGAGFAAADATGGDRSTFGTTGALLGVLGLNPRSMGVIGNTAGRISNALPQALRAYETIDQADKARKKTKRREPK